MTSLDHSGVFLFPLVLGKGKGSLNFFCFVSRKLVIRQQSSRSSCSPCSSRPRYTRGILLGILLVHCYEVHYKSVHSGEDKRRLKPWAQHEKTRGGGWRWQWLWQCLSWGTISLRSMKSAQLSTSNHRRGSCFALRHAQHWNKFDRVAITMAVTNVEQELR